MIGTKEKRFRIIFATCVLILAFLLKPVFPATVSIEAEGTASLSGQDQVTARDRALKDFEKQALIKAIMDLIGQEQYEKNKGKIEKSALTKADRYIKAYKILKEESVEETYKVRGEATIDLESLKRGLSYLNISVASKKPSKPSEQIGETQEPRPPKPTETSRIEKKHEDKPIQNTFETPVTVFWSYDRFCDQEIDGMNAGDLFDKLFTEKLSEHGLSIVPADQSGLESSINVILKGNLFCFDNKIEFKMTVERDSWKEQIEDYVPLEEDSILMDSVMTLVEISTNHLIQTLGYHLQRIEISKGESGDSLKESDNATTAQNENKSESPSPSEAASDSEPKRQTLSSAPTPWQVIIKDPLGSTYWEKIQKKLKEAGITIEVSRILITPEAFTVEVPELGEKAISLIESTLSKEGFKFKAESVDTQTKRLVIYSQDQ